MTMNNNTIIEAIKNRLGNSYTVKTMEVQKGYATYTGVSICKANDSLDVMPLLYVENYLNLFYENGEDYDMTAEAMLNDYEKAMKDADNFDIKKYTSFEYAKENLIRCISPKGILDEDCVTIPFLDLEIYFRVKMPEAIADKCNASYKVKRNLLEMWDEEADVTVDTLLTITEKNEYRIVNMADLLAEMMGDFAPEYDDETEANPMIVITNEDKMFGGAAITRNDVLEKIAEKYNSDLWVIPSSIHELICVPKTNPINGMSEYEANNMICEVNETAVSPEDKLSDHVYVFNRANVTM